MSKRGFIDSPPFTSAECNRTTSRTRYIYPFFEFICFGYRSLTVCHSNYVADFRFVPCNGLYFRGFYRNKIKYACIRTLGSFHSKYFPLDLQIIGVATYRFGRRGTCTVNVRLYYVFFFFFYTQIPRGPLLLSRPIFLLTRGCRPNCDRAISGEHTSPRRTTAREHTGINNPHHYRFSAFYYR